jgi:hypothetical protein
MDDIIANIQELTCSREETLARIEICGSCDNNLLDDIPKCNQCNCPISSLTSMSFKTCPIGKW